MDDGQILTINNTNAAEGIFFIKSINIFYIPYPEILLIIDDCNKTNLHLLILVVSQSYEAEADNEYVIRGNAAIMKCEVPSFVSDFVSVEMWTDSDGGTYYPGNNEGILPHYDMHIPWSLILIFISTPAVLQAYEARVNDEFVLKGNTAILKCIVPSFVADFVHVVAWIMDNQTVTAQDDSKVESGISYFIVRK